VPVRLEHLTSPTAEDWADLAKIQSDTRPHGFASAIELEQWITPQRWIIAGRFNDRLVGALLAEQEGDVVTLSQAGVRTITQRRGVMHQLLHFLCRWADESSFELRLHTDSDDFSAALQKRGFVADGELLRYRSV